MKNHSVSQVCTQCKITQQEGWSSHYKRVRSARNPQPFLCRECRRMKKILSSIKKDVREKKKPVLHWEFPMSETLFQRKHKVSREEARETIREMK